MDTREEGKIVKIFSGKEDHGILSRLRHLAECYRPVPTSKAKK